MENERRAEFNIGSGLEEHKLLDILAASQIRATDTYETPPQIIWIDNSTIATLGNFSASTGKAKSKKTFNVSALVAASIRNKAVFIVTRSWNASYDWQDCPRKPTTRTSTSFV